jgi:hypothetical protein
MNQWTAQEWDDFLRDAARRAAMDREFRAALLTAPGPTLQASSRKPLPNIDIRFVEDTEAYRTLVLPPMASEDGELTDADLEQVAGGVCITTS